MKLTSNLFNTFYLVYIKAYTWICVMKKVLNLYNFNLVFLSRMKNIPCFSREEPVKYHFSNSFHIDRRDFYQYFIVGQKTIGLLTHFAELVMSCKEDKSSFDLFILKKIMKALYKLNIKNTIIFKNCCWKILYIFYPYNFVLHFIWIFFSAK